MVEKALTTLTSFTQGMAGAVVVCSHGPMDTTASIWTEAKRRLKSFFLLVFRHLKTKSQPHTSPDFYRRIVTVILRGSDE
jgi:hypothetical protein